MTQYVQERVESIERPITSWALLGVIAVLLCAYAYLINATVGTIVVAKDMQAQATVLTSTVSSLESSYLAAKASVGLDYALAQGFVQPKSDSTTYLSKRSVASLSFNR